MYCLHPITILLSWSFRAVGPRARLCIPPSCPIRWLGVIFRIKLPFDIPIRIQVWSKLNTCFFSSNYGTSALLTQSLPLISKYFSLSSTSRRVHSTRHPQTYSGPHCTASLHHIPWNPTLLVSSLFGTCSPATPLIFSESWNSDFLTIIRQGHLKPKKSWQYPLITGNVTLSGQILSTFAGWVIILIAWLWIGGTFQRVHIQTPRRDPGPLGLFLATVPFTPHQPIHTPTRPAAWANCSVSQRTPSGALCRPPQLRV